jgi:hypothetical protein
MLETRHDVIIWWYRNRVGWIYTMWRHLACQNQFLFHMYMSRIAEKFNEK